MTVKELVELDNFIGDITITTRDTGKDGKNLFRVNTFHIGHSEGIVPHYHDDKDVYKSVNINTFDSGKDYYKIVTGKIPKEWLNLQVQSFRVWRSHRSSEDYHYSHHSLEHILIDCYCDGYVHQEKEKNVDEQLPGQMNIEDFL
jgi:hypothetical protein